MKKNYTIEGNIDFFSELYKSLDNEEDPHKSELDNNLCLISKLPLADNFVKLICGHKFNYVPLYNDISNHKLKFNNMETTQGHLKSNQIRCPYCRKIQNSLLPYYDNIPGVKQLDKVNYINLDNEKKFNDYNSKYSHCAYMHESVNFNLELPESSENPKKVCCQKYGYMYTINNCNDTYCYDHMKIVKQNIVIQKKEETKKAKQESKQKEKEEKQKAKDELKLSVKLAKDAAKKNKNAKSIPSGEENEVIDIIDIIDLTIDDTPNVSENVENNNSVGCIMIMKTGINKGNKCLSKIFAESMCKRHYNLNKSLLV